MTGVLRQPGKRGAAFIQCFAKRRLALVPASLLALAVTSPLILSSDRTRRIIPIPLDIAPQPAAFSAGELDEQRWFELPVQRGDSLSALFRRAGLDGRAAHRIANNAKDGRAMGRIHPGQVFGFRLDGRGQLQALRHRKSRLSSVVYRREGDGYAVETIERVPERREAVASGRIDSSLFLAGKAAGLSDGIIMGLANIFGSVIDLVHDPRRGDAFYVLYEELYLDGDKLRDGDILAAAFVNRGKSLTAFLYEDERGRRGYFSADGVSMRRAFLLAPLDFKRVSSHFNARRLHPIYRTRRPHRGTDYAAPRGTPVFAAGDGHVTEAGYTSANGNYVVLQHGERYTTKYLHLHRRNVQAGSRVRQHQVIGTVGSTGAATGPHLHYEFLIDGVHRDPRTVHRELPKPHGLVGAELAAFQRETGQFRLQLASIRQTRTAMLVPGGAGQAAL